MASQRCNVKSAEFTGHSYHGLEDASSRAHFRLDSYFEEWGIEAEQIISHTMGVKVVTSKRNDGGYQVEEHNVSVVLSALLKVSPEQKKMIDKYNLEK